MERYWINQPSTLQECHKMHRSNVLCDVSNSFGSCVTVYFTEGDIVSALIPRNALSKGWINSKGHYDHGN